MAGRFSWIRGESGNINGDGTGRVQLTAAQLTALGIPSAAGPVYTVNGAFRHFAEAEEVAVGLNYYFYRQQVKWKTDLSFYNGGNPAAGGVSPAGFIAGVDGWLLRTQIQLQF